MEAEVQGAMLKQATRTRLAYADNLKVVLVAGVIVAHVTMAFAGLTGAWVLNEPPVREPLLSLLDLSALVGALFGMPLFFLVAGMFTPRSLERKGLRQFVVDRTLRLLVPSLFFVLVFTPPIEYVDPDNAGWSRGFWPFVPHVLTIWPPAPGPTWFLGVLLFFSLTYAAVRTAWPRRTTRPAPLRVWHLLLAMAVVAVGSYLVRFFTPLGEERWHLVLAQAPAWVVGFTLGVLAGERGWFQPLDARFARGVRRTAWLAVAAVLGVMVVIAGSPSGVDPFFGGGTWQSLVFAVLEGVLMVTMSLWVVDLFQRRFNHQGPLGRGMSRAAYGAFLVHQIVLVGLVLGSRFTPWPPELRYVTVSVLGVALSFGLAALLVRLPGVSRIV
jgi:Acyltransferase family